MQHVCQCIVLFLGNRHRFFAEDRYASFQSGDGIRRVPAKHAIRHQNIGMYRIEHDLQGGIFRQIQMADRVHLLRIIGFTKSGQLHLGQTGKGRDYTAGMAAAARKTDFHSSTSRKRLAFSSGDFSSYSVSGTAQEYPSS